MTTTDGCRAVPERRLCVAPAVPGIEALLTAASATDSAFGASTMSRFARVHPWTAHRVRPQWQLATSGDAAWWPSSRR
jgi:hypothetical protein